MAEPEISGDVVASTVVDDKASILAELAETQTSDQPPPAEAEAEQPESEDSPAESDETGEAPEQEEGEEEPEETEPEKPEADEAVEPEPADEVREKRIAAIKEEERASKTRLEEHFAAKEKELEQKWSPMLKKAQEWEKLQSRAKYDPVAALEAMGYSEETFEEVARAVYAASPAGMENPQLKANAQQRAKAKEHSDDLSQTRQELQELRQTFQQQQIDNQLTSYVGAVTDALSEDHPVSSAMLSKNPGRLRTLLREEVQKVHRDTGEVPEPSEMAAHYEKIRRQVLEESGIDPSLIAKASTKKKTPAAGETETAKTLSNNISKSTKPRKAVEPKTEQDERAAILKEIQAGNFGDLE